MTKRKRPHCRTCSRTYGRRTSAPPHYCSGACRDAHVVERALAVRAHQEDAKSTMHVVTRVLDSLTGSWNTLSTTVLNGVSESFDAFGKALRR